MKSSALRILIVAFLISAIGVFSIYSSTFHGQEEGWQDIHRRQVLWIILGVLFFFIFYNLNYRRLWDATYPLYGLGILLLFMVFILGITRLGAQRWLRLVWFNFQPSEFVKIIMIIFLARYFSRKSSEEISLSVSKFRIWQGLAVPFIFVSVPVALIIEQPDLGSALMVVFIFVAILYLAGIKFRYIAMVISAGIISMPVLWHFLRGYQKERLMVFINPNLDPLGAGYTIIQSKIAIGSGGILGRGWLSGTQSQLRFLPESHTDFIFATFAEEWGLFGALVLFLLYYILIAQAIDIGLRTRDYFGKLLAFGIASMIGIQVVINISMTMGLAPVVGLPLPLMSYGGSSVVITFIALGILANIDRTRAVF